MIDQSSGSGKRTTIGRRLFPTSTGVSHLHTTWTERFLLLTSIVILPLQDHFPPVAGMSISFLIFAALAVYIILNRPRMLSKIWYHPVFLAAYAFIIVGALLEVSSPLSRYDEIIRFALMIVGAVSIAVLCRDRSALAAGLYGYIAAGLWVAVTLYTTSYGTLQSVDAEDFTEASRARAEAFADKPVAANIDGLAFVCVQGAIVALALCLSERWKHVRLLLLGVTAFCLIASFLPMSRGAVLMGLMSFGAMFYACGIKYGKALMFACILGLGVYALVPTAVWSRMEFSTQVNNGQMEARARLFTNALDRLPEYILSGVGAGNYWGDWGSKKGFAKQSHVKGAHNTFFQIAIYWGIFGLLGYLLILWCLYRAIPLRCGRDELAVALVGLLVSLGALLFQSHNYYDKPFALGMGLLIGARYWIWPTGVVPEVGASKCPSGAEAQIASLCSLKK